MAKVKIQGNASGTGVLTVTAPNTSTDRTVTLPDATGTLVNTAPSTSGNVLTSDGTNWTSAAAAAGGKVLQVVSVTKTDTFTSSGTASWVDITGLAATITPISTSSKIMVMVDLKAAVMGHGSFRITRNSTAIGIGDTAGSRTRAGAHSAIPASGAAYQEYTTSSMDMSVLDSPTTTSAVTYKTQGATPYSSTYTIYINRSTSDASASWLPRTASTITLMEIGA